MKQNAIRHFIRLTPVIAVVIVLPLFITNNYYMTVLNRVLINIIVVLGLNFITGLTGQMNLGTAGIFALGSYTSSLLAINLGISPWFGLLAALGMGLLIGRGLGYPSLRIKGVYLSLTTIGFSEIVRLLITNMAKFTGGTQGLRNIPPYQLFGYRFESQRSLYFLFLTFVIIAYIISRRIVYSKWGRVFKSLRDNVDAVEACGVDIASIKIKAFTLASIYGAIGGAMYAHYMGYINPSSYTLDLSINYVVMLMVGGIGSVAGNVFGAIIVTVLPEILRFLQTYYQLVFNIIILVGAIFFPKGWVQAASPLLRKLRISMGFGHKSGGS